MSFRRGADGTFNAWAKPYPVNSCIRFLKHTSAPPMPGVRERATGQAARLKRVASHFRGRPIGPTLNNGQGGNR